MGVSLKSIRVLSSLVEQGLVPKRASILEYGTQNMLWTSKDQEVELAGFIAQMRSFNGLGTAAVSEWLSEAGTGCLMGDFMLQCGFKYTAIDIASGESTLLFDLNTDSVPPMLLQKFDLVTNFGTSEHVLNQYNVFRTMHDFTCDHGLMYHDLPMGGYFFHGYFSYTPLFFFHLAQANNYDIIFRRYWKAAAKEKGQDTPEEMIQHGWPDSWTQDVGIEFIFRKIGLAPFRVPVEIGTTNGPVDEAYLTAKGVNFRILAGVHGTVPPTK